MKAICSLLVAALLAALGCSCSSLRSSPEQRREREIADSVAHARSAQLLTSRSFLIMAKTIRIARMGTKEVIPEHNFLMMDNGRAVISFSPFFSGAPNGVGGTTCDGVVENFKEKVSDNGEIYITFKVAKGSRKANVSITLPARSGRAMVNVNGSATLYGQPQRYDPTLVIEGMY